MDDYLIDDVVEVEEEAEEAGEAEEENFSCMDEAYIRFQKYLDRIANEEIDFQRVNSIRSNTQETLDWIDNEECDFQPLYSIRSNTQETLDWIDDDVQPVSSKRSNTQVITQKSLLAAQREDLLRVMEMLSIKKHHARTLLIHYQWNVEKLFDVFVEKGKDSLFSEAGVTLFDYQHDNPHSSNMSCDVCVEDVLGDQMTRMDCGHCFCNTCWTEHFIVQINEGQSKRIRCMADKCNAICDEDVVRNLVSTKHPDLVEKFDRFLLESYIEDNKMVKWCPSTPHCGNAIRVEGEKLCEVECSCGLQFCFGCQSRAHSPCSCLMWKLWRKKCTQMTIRTKLCPKCQTPVEKNGGCNLITCICGQCFCWLCGGATGSHHNYNTISGHTCGHYKDDKEKQVERAKKDLDRFTHYKHRYKAHMVSSMVEYRLKCILERVSNSDCRELKLKNLSWVTNELNKLFRSRQILSHSYAFAYYMFGEESLKDEMSLEVREMKKYLFEDIQQLLESNVEKLFQLLEEISDYNLVKIKIQIFDMSAVVDSLCKKMYECIENDLLGSLQCGIHNIAPYRSEGIEQAAEFYDKFQSLESCTSGETLSLEQASRSRNSEETICSSSNKRPKRGLAISSSRSVTD